MHIAEEVFRSIRMSEMEFAHVIHEVNLMIEEHNIEMMAYPALDTLFGAIGVSAEGGSDTVEEISLTLDPDA